MNFRTNVILGWVLAALFVGLGLSMIGRLTFKEGRPEKMGYPIEGVVEEGAGDGAAAAPAVPIETLMASAEVTKGEAVFKKCASCHNAQQNGANGIGPNLYGIVGHQVAAHPGFAYSDALKAKGGTWTFQALNEWLTNPRKYAEGTKMSFAGLTNPEDRANVIAYLNAQGSNLPIPAAPPRGARPGYDAGPGQHHGGRRRQRGGAGGWREQRDQVSGCDSTLYRRARPRAAAVNLIHVAPAKAGARLATEEQEAKPRPSPGRRQILIANF